ncbi:hypothetical protein [Escherichia coli]|uniref:hypothetical protein n=1 Tax=Escherichia coli TaxID=562 RepID=UPI00201AE971|nr:hypothetical protein [Escherichia coli]
MAMGSVVHLLFFLSEQCYLMPFSTYRIGTEASANPVWWKGTSALSVQYLYKNHFIGSGALYPWNGSAGGDCANTSRLQGYVAGALISTNASNNPSYGKTAFISFAVPAGATYQITSYPAQNYSCGSGVFSVFGYQT